MTLCSSLYSAVESYSQAITPYIPIVTPAVYQDRCEVDQSLLLNRIFSVITVAFVSLIATTCIASVFPSMAIFVIVIPLASLFLLPLDHWCSENAADEKAVQEYLNKPFPSQSATDRIRYSQRALKLLVKNNADLNKVNNKGEELISSRMSSEEIIFLVCNGAIPRITFLSTGDMKVFDRSFSLLSDELVECLLNRGFIKPEQFTSDQQVQLWLSISSITAANKLKENRFNINVKDSKGYTPLHRAVMLSSVRDDEVTMRVTAFLNCGADQSLTVVHNNQEKTALSLAVSEKTRQILCNKEQEHIF